MGRGVGVSACGPSRPRRGILEAVWWRCRWPLRERRGVSVPCRVKVGAIVAVSVLVGVGAALALLYNPLRQPFFERACRIRSRPNRLGAPPPAPVPIFSRPGWSPRARARDRSVPQWSRGHQENASSSIRRRKEARKALCSSGRCQKTPSGVIQAFHFCGTNCGITFITYCFYWDNGGVVGSHPDRLVRPDSRWKSGAGAPP